MADLADRQRRIREEQLARPGARVIVEVADKAETLRVQRFDPIRLFVLDAGEVVQANFITLAGPGGSVEISNPRFARNLFAGTVALTVSAGRHPLSDGIRQVIIVGIQDAPQVDRGEDSITVVARGVRIELRGLWTVSFDSATTISANCGPNGRRSRRP